MKKALTTIALLLLLLLLLNSCITKIALKSMGVWDEKASEKIMYNGTKQLVFISMHHIGKQEYYNDVKEKLDSLHEQGYIVFYEKVVPPPGIDSLKKDTLIRKFRKVVGSLYANGYINKEEGTLMGKKFSFVKDLTNQPFGETIGLDSLIDQRVDVYLHDLIKAYELKYNTIILDECDTQTKLKEKYVCEKINNKEGRDFFLKIYRNEFIANAITNSSNSKIVLLYGGNHFEGIFNLLRKSDPKWQLK